MSRTLGKAFSSILVLAAIIVLTALIYLPAVNQTTLWEDNELISGVAIGNARTLAECFSRPFLYNYYRPLTSASFLVDRWAGGENPLTRHTTNLALHLLTIPAIFALLYAAFRSSLTACAGAFLFAFQPVQMLPTAWIGGRTDSLCVLFAVVFGWSLVTAVRSRGPKQLVWMMASWLAYAAAVMAKEQAIVLLVMAPLAFRCFGENAGRSWRVGLASGIPLLLIAVAFSAAWLILVPQLRQELPSRAADTVYNIGQTMCYYGAVFVAPSQGRLFTIHLGGYDGIVFVSAGLLVLAGGATLCLFLFRRAPDVCWFLCFALVAILPVCGILPMASLPVGPYRAAISGIGAAGFLAWLFTPRYESASAHYRRRIASARIGTGVLYGAVCAWLILWGLVPFRSAAQINRTFVRFNPDSVFAKLELSESLLFEGDIEEANVLMDGLAYRRPDGIVQASNNPPQLYHLNMGDYDRYLARLFTTLAYKRFAQGNRDAAKRALDVAKFMMPDDTNVNLGAADYSIAVGDLATACAALRNALYTDQSMVDRRIMLSRLLIKLGLFDEAKIELRECIRRDNRLKDAYLLLAESEWKSGSPGGARTALERGVRSAALTESEANMRLSSRSFESKQ